MEPNIASQIANLCKEAARATDEFSPGVAARYYEEALQLDPSDAHLWHKCGEAYIEFGKPKEATNAFLKSIELSPDSNPNNYLYLAQQLEGHESETQFLKAIEILKRDFQSFTEQYGLFVLFFCVYFTFLSVFLNLITCFFFYKT